MKKQWRLFLCGFVVLTVVLAPRLATAEDSSYQALANHFFEMLKAGKGAEAVDYLMGTNPAMKKVPDQMEQLRSGFASLGPMMGNYISQQKLIETKVADMLVYQHYFVAYERQPISVRIEFYKPAGKWMAYSLQFDTKLPDSIQQQADNNLRTDTQY